MKIPAIFATVLLLASICAAQDSATSSESLESPSDQQSIAAAARASRAHTEAAKEADIRHLLEVTNAGALAIQTMSEMETSMKPLISNALPEGEYRDKLVGLFFDKFHSKINPQQLIELIIPVYSKYYSDDEIKQLTELYGTPLGHKMILVTPKIMAESQEAGGKWGRELGRQCMMEVLAEHPEFIKSMEEAKKNPPKQ